MNTQTQAYETKPQPETLNAAIAALGLSVKAEFVPLSLSRNKGEKHPTLNWLITLLKDGKEILSADYSAGSAYCPAYKASIKRLGGRNSVMRDEAIRWECEHGRASFTGTLGLYAASSKGALLPNSADVIHSLVLDAEVLNSPTYEDWASEFGYDRDSRKGEAIYRECLKLALKLRAGLGEKALAELTEACQDF